MICNRALAGSVSGSRVSRATSRAAPPARRAALVTRAGAENGQFAFAEGARVKVVTPIKVFHVPKHPEVELEGLEGTVKKIAALHKGALMSATMQYRVQFLTKMGDADVKFFAHLAEEEIEAA